MLLARAVEAERSSASVRRHKEGTSVMKLHSLSQLHPAWSNLNHRRYRGPAAAGGRAPCSKPPFLCPPSPLPNRAATRARPASCCAQRCPFCALARASSAGPPACYLLSAAPAAPAACPLHSARGARRSPRLPDTHEPHDVLVVAQQLVRLLERGGAGVHVQDRVVCAECVCLCFLMS